MGKRHQGLFFSRAASRAAHVVCGSLLCLAFCLFPKLSLAQTPLDTGTFKYRLDPSQSTLMIHADRAGLAWFKGHSHRIAVRDFEGEASLSLDSLNPASLRITMKAGSLEETDPIFTAQQKAIIKKELNDIVLETAKYPEISFKSTAVKGSIGKNGVIQVQITGDLTLHGVTRRVVIPASVTVNGDTLRADGVLAFDRTKFNVKATSAFHGLVRVKKDLKLVFAIIGVRQ